MKNNKYAFPLFIVATMFSVLGFAVGINAFFIPYVQQVFSFGTGMSYLVATATFSAFVLFGVPSALFINKYGYKKSIFWSYIVMGLGMLLIIPAAKLGSFPLLLLALFVNGMGQTMLNTAINPYITILGPLESAAKRISIMGMCNKSCYGLAPIVLSFFMDTVNVQLQDAIIPFYIITLILIVLAVISIFSPLPEIEAEGETKESEAKTKNREIFHYPHLLLGALAILFYVGVETISLASIADYARTIGLSNPQQYTMFTSFGFILGYLVGTIAIPKYMSQVTAIKLFSILGVVLSLLLVILPIHYSIWCLALLGFANSLLWPAIWPLALSDLGPLTKIGSSILVMGIVGGGILPPVLGILKDMSSYQTAYWMIVPIYMYFVYYAYLGNKIRLNK